MQPYIKWLAGGVNLNPGREWGPPCTEEAYAS